MLTLTNLKIYDLIFKNLCFSRINSDYYRTRAMLYGYKACADNDDSQIYMSLALKIVVFTLNQFRQKPDFRTCLSHKEYKD